MVVSLGTNLDNPRRGRRSFARWSAFLAAFGLAAFSGSAHAQEALPVIARAAFGPALMTSPDQTGPMGFDSVGVSARLQVGYLIVPWMDLHLGLGAGAFPGAGGDTGAAIAPTLGGLAMSPTGSLRPFVSADFGVAFTGPLSRPYFHGGLGFDVQIARAFTIGPMLGYAQLIQKDGPRSSSDARSFELCATVTFRPFSDPPPEPKTIYVYKEQVVEVPAPPAPPSANLEVLLDGAIAIPKARIELLAPVLFKLASDELEPVGVAMLHEVARELRARQDIRLIEIEGYTDARGSAELNAELSERRAQRVLDWLVEHGVEPERMRTAAHGAQAQVDTAGTEQAHEQNRRVVFRVIEDL